MCYQHENCGSSELEQDFCIRQVIVGEQAYEAGNHRAYISGYCKYDEQSCPEEVGLVFQQSHSDEIWYCYYDHECEEQYQLGTDNVRHGQGQGIVALRKLGGYSSSGTMPTAALTSIGSAVASIQRTIAVPEVGGSWPLSICRVVVLPAPLGPMKTKNSPCAIRR